MIAFFDFGKRIAEELVDRNLSHDLSVAGLSPPGWRAIASVSSCTPSPTAPKSQTSTEPKGRFAAGEPAHADMIVSTVAHRRQLINFMS